MSRLLLILFDMRPISWGNRIRTNLFFDFEKDPIADH